MFKKIRTNMLSTIATLAISAALLGVQAASTWLWYQPEVPERLKDK